MHIEIGISDLELVSVLQQCMQVYALQWINLESIVSSICFRINMFVTVIAYIHVFALHIFNNNSARLYEWESLSFSLAHIYVHLIQSKLCSCLYLPKLISIFIFSKLLILIQ